MAMRKIIYTLLTSFVLLSVAPTQSRAGTNPDTVVVSQAIENTDMNTLMARVEEIQAMDFSNLSREERKELKKELNAIQRQLKEEGKAATTATSETSSGVYISFGALIIIILLLIIIL